LANTQKVNSKRLQAWFHRLARLYSFDRGFTQDYTIDKCIDSARLEAYFTADKIEVCVRRPN